MVVRLRSSWRDLRLVTNHLEGVVDLLLLILVVGLFLLFTVLFAHHLFELVFVLLTEDAGSLLSLRNQVVRRGVVVESVSLHVRLALFHVDIVVLFEQLEDFRNHGDDVAAHDDALLLVRLNLVVPRMGSDVFDGEPLGGIRVQNQIDQVFGLLAEETGHFVVGLQDFLVELLSVLVLEWEITTHHGIKYNATAPNVSTKPEVFFALDHFRSCVTRTTTGSLEPLVLLVKVAQAEVDDFDAIVVIEQQIFWLQVSVDDAQFVNVLYAGDDLLVHFGSFILLEPAVFDDVLEELSARTILHDQVQVIIVFNHLVQLNDVRVPDFLEDCDFSVDSVNIGLILDFIFFQYFDGHLVASYNVRSLFDFAEGSLTFGFPDDEASDLLSLAIFLLFWIFILISCCALILVGFFFLGTILCLLGFLFRRIFIRCFGNFWLTSFIGLVITPSFRWRVTVNQ